MFYLLTLETAKMNTRITQVVCPICKTRTRASAYFCEQCRYPIGVKKLDASTAEEISLQLSNLAKVVAHEHRPLFRNRKTDDLFTELVSLYWLRPESALWRFLEMRIALRFKKKYLTYPLLDLGCGDGLWTALLFGAKVNKKYDAFEAVDLDESDVFNTYVRPPADFLMVPPSPIGFGLDIKKSSVRKARALAVYDKVKVGDARELPFPDSSVNSVFSNMIDDIKAEDLQKVFTEAHRVLRKGGYMVFTTPNERFRKSLFYFNKARAYQKRGDAKNYALFSTLDRGRSEWEPRPLSLWRTLFARTSFELIDHIKYADESVVQLWDTGLRPFFKQLMGARKALREQGMLLPAKEVAVEILKQWLWRYAKEETSRSGAFSMIVAKKRQKSKD